MTHGGPRLAWRRRRGRIGLVAACFVLSALLGCIWNVFALIVRDLEQAFAVTRVEASLGFSLLALSHAISAPLLAAILARFDSRRVMAWLSLALAAGLGLAAVAGSLAVFYVAFGLMTGVGTQALGSYFIFALLANRLHSGTGRAMAIADAGAGVGLFVGLPAMQLLIVEGSWRLALGVLAATVAIVGPLVHLLVLPRLRIGVRRPPGPREVQGSMRRASIMLGASMLIGAAVLQGLQTQQVAALQAFGASADASVAVISAIGLAMILCRLGAGMIADRSQPRTAMLVAASGATLAFLAIGAFAVEPWVGWLALYAVAVATGFSGQGILFAAQARLIFPPRQFLAALSIVRVCAGMGLFAGPLLAAAAFQISGYAAMFGTLAMLSLLHFALFFLSTPRRGGNSDA